MRLYVTVVAAPGLVWDVAESHEQHPAHLLTQLPNAPVELALEVESDSGAAIVTHLGLETPTPVRFWVEGADLGTLRVGKPPLVNGAVIVATPPDGSVPVRHHRFNHDLVFSVLSGPDSGELKVLRRGVYSIGRAGDSISIADPLLSRHHAQLTVEAARVRLKDCASANGTLVDQTRITAAPVTTESIMQMGSSRCSLRFSDESKPLPQSHPDPSDPLVISRDVPQQRRGAMMLTALLPVVIGVGLALLTGMWIFLAFSAVSAVTMLVPVFGGSGRRAKFKKDLEAARIADGDRRLAATPFLADTIRHALEGAAAVSRPGYRAQREVKDIEQSALSRWVRLGTASQPANLCIDPPDKGFVPPALAAMPVALNLSVTNQLVIAGADDQMAAMVRSLAIQISQSTAQPQRLLFCGPLSVLPLSARFLPGTQLVPTAADAVSALHDAEGIPPVLFISHDPDTSREEATIRQMLATGRLNVIWYGADVFREDIPTLSLSRESAVFRNGQEELRLVPDMVGERNFDRYCRARARLLASNPATIATTPKMPVRAPLNGIAVADVEGIRNSWRRTIGEAAQLEAPIGATPSGFMSIDLQQDGPHLLVAGTTGSGKSELLRTLVMSLAMRHSPSKLNFLFVDFKGGSGLGPLQRLPHSVGMLTDLSTEAIGRAMESLRAEVRRRELLFAQAEAADLASYRRLRPNGMEELTHLMLVIDEYRMLLEEVPDAMDELLRIATLGRSLGLHLVMATQRPQGAVSADIRANVTTSIALRVQSAMESQDVIDSSVAAGISVKVPGRAYLKRGAESPQQFQSGSTSETTSKADGDNGPVTITTLHNSLEAGTLQVTPSDFDSRSAALAGYISAVLAAWKELDCPPARRPITDPLPERLTEVAPWPRQGAGSPEGPSADEDPIPLGLLDLPSVQQQKPLIWEPVKDSHLALVGAPLSGLNSSLRHIVGQLLRRDIRRTHLYVLDGDGTLPGLDRDYHVGAYVSADEIRRAVRVIELLVETLSDRLASDPDSPRSGMKEDESGQPAAHKKPASLILIISSWGRWVSAIRGSPWPWAEDYVRDLVRDGGKAGVILIIGGDRELATARFFAVITNRIYLPTGASSESLMSWPKLPKLKKLPGRAFVQGRFVPAAGISQLIPCSSSTWRESNFHSAIAVDQEHLPFRVAALPRLVLPTQVTSRVTEDEVLLGVRGDDLRPIALQMASAEVLLILGAPKSGKSTALEMIAAMGSDNRRWIAVSSADLDPVSSQGLMTELEATETDPSKTTLLVDNIDRLPQRVHQSLTNLHNRGYSVIMTATTGPTVMSKIPLAMPARSTGKGILLAPRSALDGDFFGVRIDAEPRFIPGRAVIIEGGTCVPAQLFWPATVNE